MIDDAIARSNEFAAGALASARAALRTKDADAIATAGTIPGVRRPSCTRARSQYRANRGWVFACTRLVAQRIAGQPIYVAKDAPSFTTKAEVSDTGHLEPMQTHPLLDVLADPNEHMTGAALMTVTVLSIELTGRSLWYVDPDPKRATGWQILPIPTHWIESIEPDGSAWHIRPEGSSEVMTLPGERVVNFYYPDPANPFTGCMSPLQRIAEAVEADQAIIEAQWTMAKAGPFPRHAVRVGKTPDPSGTLGRPRLTPTQRRQLIDAIQSAYAGAASRNEPIILDALVEDVFRLTLSASEMDFLNSSEMTKKRILEGFGVSPILLGQVEGANRASATTADEIFVSTKVNPLIRTLSESMTAWLGPLFGDGLIVWIAPAVAHDAELSLRRYTLACQYGAVTKNELRRQLLNMPDMTGGDVPVVPAVASPMLPAMMPAKHSALFDLFNDVDPYTLKTHERNGRAGRLAAGTS
ncbi:MAG: phage portal protein [Thermoguttaceae bacterium]|jgi:HK97 family phage portal protein|nr:phage portal protein [Thermoguttaceae bacterium]